MSLKKNEIKAYWLGYAPSITIFIEELRQFCDDVVRVYDALHTYPDGSSVGTVYRNFNRAMKAFDTYDISEHDFEWLGLIHPLKSKNDLKLRQFLKTQPDYSFVGFRHKLSHRDRTLLV